MPSIERVLGHELGHANIWATGGEIAMFIDQKGAVSVENEISRQLDPDAPVRHPTMGHGTRYNGIAQ